MIERSTQKYALIALGSAALFGISTPLAKLLLGETHPVLLAGLLYCGSGLGLALFSLVRRASGREHAVTALHGMDFFWLGCAVLCGGIAGPVLLLWGLGSLPASEASLLLNLEAVLTVLLAGLLFKEHVSGRVWASTAVMLAAGTVLVWTPGESLQLSMAALLVLGACLAWALDNNLTRNISSADPVSIAMIKGLVAGAANVALAAAAGASLPAMKVVAAALVLGALSYGASLVLYIVAQRHLGSARTGAHFATAPFIGAAVALLLGENAGPVFWMALALMVLATGLLVTEQHAHGHRHERMEHEHAHVHDEHHRHEHAPGEEGEPHSHRHVHEPMAHSHPHLPDTHHRHSH